MGTDHLPDDLRPQAAAAHAQQDNVPVTRRTHGISEFPQIIDFGPKVAGHSQPSQAIGYLRGILAPQCMVVGVEPRGDVFSIQSGRRLGGQGRIIAKVITVGRHRNLLAIAASYHRVWRNFSIQIPPTYDTEGQEYNRRKSGFRVSESHARRDCKCDQPTTRRGDD